MGTRSRAEVPPRGRPPITAAYRRSTRFPRNLAGAGGELDGDRGPRSDRGDPWVIWGLGPGDIIDRHRPERIRAGGQAEPKPHARMRTQPTRDVLAGSDDRRLTLQPGTRTITLDGCSEQIKGPKRPSEIFRRLSPKQKGEPGHASKEIRQARPEVCYGRLDTKPSGRGTFRTGCGSPGPWQGWATRRIHASPARPREKVRHVRLKVLEVRNGRR